MRGWRTSGLMRALLAGLASAASASSCTQLASEFVCQCDAACESASGEPAICEPATQRCSVQVDPAVCASERRYDELAGALSGTCAPRLAAPTLDCVEQLAAGGHATCVVERDGSLWCWGNGHHAPERIAVPVAAIAEIALGGAGLCVRDTSNDVACASSPFGTLQPMQPLKATSIAVGARHMCAATPDAGVVCWGSNANGQLGIGAPDADAHSMPTQPAREITGAVQVAAGGETSCAVDGAGLLWCWGAARDPDDIPVLGRGICAGCNVGIPTPIMPIVDKPPPMVAVAVAAHAACARTVGTPDGDIWCWGTNQQGELGNSMPGGTSSTPKPIATPARFARLVCGDGHCCALDATGQLACWGDNTQHQISETSLNPVRAPRDLGDEVAPSLRFTHIAAGAQHTCARASDGQVWCWGSDAAGELGDGPDDATSSPATVPIVCPAPSGLRCSD